MFTAPFAGSIVNADTGNTGTVAEQDVSDYGTDGTGSKSPMFRILSWTLVKEILSTLISTTLLRFTMEFIVIYLKTYSRLYPLMLNIVPPVQILVVASLLSPR